MNERAMFNLGYGLYVLSAREGEKDNGCIINTAMQVTSTPNRISITINKQNYTHDMIIRTGMFNLSVLLSRRLSLCFSISAFVVAVIAINLRIGMLCNVRKMVYTI